MLRLLFNEPRREDTGKLLKASSIIKETISLLEAQGRVPSSSQAPKNQLKARRLALWSKGFVDALNELEQSQYCCQRYASEVHKSYVEEMDIEELDHYHRFVYFYKNAFIRVFSILDKLGYFMNDLYDLRTEKIKPRFSYFTVLRRMHDSHLHQTLEQRLYDLKVEYKIPLAHLREHRNTEIHYINVEMIDDLGQDPLLGNRIHVEDVAKHVKDLQDGFEMVCRSLETAFTYISAGLRKG